MSDTTISQQSPSYNITLFITCYHGMALRGIQRYRPHARSTTGLLPLLPYYSLLLYMRRYRIPVLPNSAAAHHYFVIFRPNIDQTLHQIAHVCLADSLLHHTLDVVVNRITTEAVRRSQIWL